MIKWINGIVDLVGIDEVIFEKTRNVIYYKETKETSKPFHYDVEYYELKDMLGKDELSEDVRTYCGAKGDLGLFQLALKSSGATTPLEIGKLIEKNIVQDAKIQTINYHGILEHRLYIEGFSPHDALKYIAENEYKNNIHIMKVYRITDKFLNSERELVMNNDISTLPPVAYRQTIAINQDLQDIKEKFRMLQLQQDCKGFSIRELNKVASEAKEIQFYADRYIRDAEHKRKQDIAQKHTFIKEETQLNNLSEDEEEEER